MPISNRSRPLLLAAEAGNAAARWLPAHPPEPQGNRSTFLRNELISLIELQLNFAALHAFVFVWRLKVI